MKYSALPNAAMSVPLSDNLTREVGHDEQPPGKQVKRLRNICVTNRPDGGEPVAVAVPRYDGGYVEGVPFVGAYLWCGAVFGRPRM